MQNGKTSITTVVARYQETDRMGIVHHSVYPVWFEVGRTDLIKEYGLTYTQMEAAGILLPLIGLESSYKNYALYEDRLLIQSTIDSISNTRLSFAYTITRADAEDKTTLIAIGKTHHIFTNAALKPMNVKRFRPDILALFLESTDRR